MLVPGMAAMEPKTSWSGTAAAAACAFLGAALAASGEVPGAGLASLLTALVVPVLAGWTLWARPAAVVRVGRAAVAFPAAGLAVVCAWSAESLGLTPWGAAGALLLPATWAAALPDLVGAGSRARRALSRRHPLVRGLPAAALVALAGGAWLSALLSWPAPDTRMAFAADLQARLLAGYPHREAGAPDLRVLWALHAPRLRAADRACGAQDPTCEPFVHALRDWMAELRNGHTWAGLDGEIIASDVLIEPVEGQAVVTEVGEVGLAAGLEPGMVVVAVDGLPVARAVSRQPTWVTAYGAPRTRRYYAFRALLDGAPGTAARVEVETEAGERRLLRVPRGGEAEPVPEEVGPEVEAPVQVERLERGYGYVWLEGFEGPTFGERADAAIDAVADLPGLVLDLRHNAGGYTDLSRAVLGRFFSRPVTVGLDCIADPERPGGSSCTDHRVEPRGSTYGGPVAVLIDEDVFSAGELAAYGLCATGRARCFGRPTAGETDAVVELPFPGGRVGYAVSDFRSLSGTSLFGRGVVPQQVVPQRLEDVRAGRDPELAAALAWLDQAVARRAALAPHP